MLFIICFLLSINVSNLLAQDDYIIKTQWGQKNEYAKFSPDNYRLGCWSTALSQIMYYHKLVPQGTVNYTCTNGIKISEAIDISDIDFNPSTIDIEQAALYSYYTSIIIQKDFNTGSYILKHSERAKILEDFYNCNTSYYSSNKRPVTEIEKIIAKEIKNERPVMMHIRDSLKNSYHAVVVDGYKKDKNQVFVHINFGWEGKSDGWYDFYKPILKYNDVSYRKIITVKKLQE